MKNAMRKWKRWGVWMLAVLTLGLAIACQSGSSTLDEEAVSADCTPVEHFAGTTCIPEAFERLITLDSVVFEDAIALGLNPIATVFSSLSSHLQSHVNGIENVGQSGEPNLEKALSLNPDLILGLDFHQTIYPQASRIAPTVLVEFEHSGQWKEVFQTISAALGKADVGQQVMNSYHNRLEEFKAAMGDRLPQTQVSVVRIYPNSINLYLRDSFPGIVLQDAGLARPPAQDLSATEAQRLANNPIQMQISRELLSQADADILFVWTAENEPEANQAAQKKFQELQNDPLWQTLRAVQNQKVYFVPNYWIGSGPLAANAIIDDLFKYLVDMQ